MCNVHCMPDLKRDRKRRNKEVYMCNRYITPCDYGIIQHISRHNIIPEGENGYLMGIKFTLTIFCLLNALQVFHAIVAALLGAENVECVHELQERKTKLTKSKTS